MTADRVAAPYTPSTDRPARRLALSSRWTTLTASPLLPEVRPDDQLLPGRRPDDPVGGQAVRCLERLDRLDGRRGKDAIDRRRDAVCEKKALDRLHVDAAIAEALGREADGHRGRARRRRREQEDRRKRAAGGGGRLWHGRNAIRSGQAATRGSSARRGGSAPARWHVLTATAIAKRDRVAERLRCRPGPSRPEPRSIQRARKPPPNASPAPTVSTTVDRRDRHLE